MGGELLNHAAIGVWYKPPQCLSEEDIAKIKRVHPQRAAEETVDVHIAECSGHNFSMQKSFNRFLDNIKAEYKQAIKKRLS